MIRPSLKVPPALPLVTLEELKVNARIGFDDDDALLQSYLNAAIAHLDGYAGILGRCLVTQTWEQGFVDWCYRLRLPFPDVASATIAYVDADGAEKSVAGSLFEIVEGPMGAEVVFKDDFSEPSLSDDAALPIKISFEAGYGAPGDVPDDIKLVVTALARHWFDGQEGLPPQMVMLDKYRFVPV